MHLYLENSYWIYLYKFYRNFRQGSICTTFYQKILCGNITRGDGSDAAHVAALGGAADGHGGHQIGQDGARWLWDRARWAGIVVMTTEND